MMSTQISRNSISLHLGSVNPVVSGRCAELLLTQANLPDFDQKDVQNGLAGTFKQKGTVWEILLSDNLIVR